MNNEQDLESTPLHSVSLPSLVSIIDNLDEGILFLDKDRHVVAINQAAIEMIGHGLDERGPAAIIGRLCPSLFRSTECAWTCEKSGHCSLMERTTEEKKEQDITLQRPDSSLVSLRMWAMALSTGEPLARCAIILKNRTRERQLEDEVSARLRLGGLLGHSRAMQQLFQQILRISASEATVLITGESGTGKELVARAIHEHSSRAKGPYVRVHCAALAESLLESELFGHARGAFTGAATARAGRFEAADGGTLLLDEIGEISPSIQVKLLRVLQEREVERLGENQPRKVDVRIIAATNRDLAAMVKAGTFREDLYYRLRVLPLQTPALRERREDIPFLTDHLLAEMAGRYGRDDVSVSQDAVNALRAYGWPGNVRELVNALEYALVHAEGATILPRHLPAEVVNAHSAATSAPAAASAQTAIAMPAVRYYRAPSADEEAEMIRQVLQEAGGNKAEAARRLGMSRTTLWKRLRALGMEGAE